MSAEDHQHFPGMAAWQRRVLRELSGWTARMLPVMEGDPNPPLWRVELAEEVAHGDVLRTTVFEGTDQDAVVRAAHDYRRGVL